MKISARRIAGMLLVPALLFCPCVMQRTEAADRSYITAIDRAPGVSRIITTDKKKLTIVLGDSRNVETVTVLKYNSRRGCFETADPVRTKINTGYYDSTTHTRKLEIPADYFEAGTKTKIRLVLEDLRNGGCRGIQSYEVTRLKNAVSGKWFSVTCPAAFELDKTVDSRTRKFCITAKDSQGIRDMRVLDANDGFRPLCMTKGASVLSRVSLYVDLNDAVMKNGEYQLTVQVQSTGTIRLERIHLQHGYDWENSGFPYNYCGVKCPLFIQSDPRWGSVRYSAEGYGGTIASGGCGACALAMAVSGLTDSIVTPTAMVQFLNANNTNTIYSSERASRLAAQHYGLTYEFISRYDKARIDQALDQGKVLIFSIVYNGIYTGDAHFITCVGRNGNAYYVMESGGYYQVNRGYSFSQVFSPGYSGVFALGRG